MELEGVGVPAEVVVAVGQVVHARKRVGVVGAEVGFLERERRLVQLEGVGVPAEVGVAVGQAVHASKRVRVVGAAVFGIYRAGRLVLLGRDLGFAQVRE